MEFRLYWEEKAKYKTIIEAETKQEALDKFFANHLDIDENAEMESSDYIEGTIDIYEVD
jgi:hypothetical protein